MEHGEETADSDGKGRGPQQAAADLSRYPGSHGRLPLSEGNEKQAAHNAKLACHIGRRLTSIVCIYFRVFRTRNARHWRAMAEMQADISMRDFAYGPGMHRIQIQRQKEQGLADRTSFPRCRIIRCEGTWHGK
jgi:hypothetical protein